MDKSAPLTVFSIGHSDHPWPNFERLLTSVGVEVLIDVRSHPSSRLPHFSRPTLRAALNTIGVSYVYMGAELGGRPASGAAADYEAMAKSSLFADALNRVQDIAARARPVLMCSEHEPTQCHRCLLIGRRLAERGVSVEHILRDGSVEGHKATEERLLKLTRQTEADLFGTREERLERAYRAQNHRLWRSTSPANRRTP